MIIQNKLTRYKIVALRTKKSSRLSLNNYFDEITVSEGDVFFGFSYANHMVGKHLDMWLTNERADDPDNFVGFARIMSITDGYDGKIYITHSGHYLVKEMDSAGKVLLGMRKETKGTLFHRENGVWTFKGHAQQVRGELSR